MSRGLASPVALMYLKIRVPQFDSMISAISLLVSLLLGFTALGEEFQAGTGRSDITPTEPVRLAGYAGRNHPFERIDQHLFVKALAVRDPAGRTTLIIT